MIDSAKHNILPEAIEGLVATWHSATVLIDCDGIGEVGDRVSVQLQDAYANDVASSGVSVSMVLGGSGALNGTSTQLTDASGKAVFADLKINLAGSFC